MSFTKLITTLFFSDIRTTFITFIGGYIFYKLFYIYAKRLTLPPGPFPLPILGNILELGKGNLSRELERTARKYGPAMTFWIGHKPVIVISDLELSKQAFGKNELSGRTKNVMTQLINNGNETGVIFADGPVWDTLRHVVHTGANKFGGSDTLIDLVVDQVDHTVKTIVEKETIGKPFSLHQYGYNMCMNIFALAAFGKRYELDDPVYKAIYYMHEGLFDHLNKWAFLWDVFPVLRKIDPRYYKLKNSIEKVKAVLRQGVDQHMKDFDESSIRGFCDTLIAANKEAIKSGRLESAQHLSAANLSLVLFDVLIAGTDAAQIGFRWLLLHMLHNKEVEKKLRQEIESEIGDHIPTHEDKNRCHYVMAFISEVLRFSSVVPMGTPHRAMDSSQIGDYKISKGQEVIVYHGHIMHQEKHFTNPHEFKPDRFLENGQMLSTRPKGFIPFGVGRRVCLGEKLAVNDLFLVLVRFLQKTSDFDIKLHLTGDGDPLSPDLNKLVHFIPYTLHYQPKPFKISLHKK